MENIRAEMESTPCGRLAAVARAEIHRQYDTITFTGRLPDYADLRAAMDLHVEAELTNARMEEATLTPNNEARVRQLFAELMDIFARQRLIQKFHDGI